jgi:inorganic pyrophosphatase
MRLEQGDRFPHICNVIIEIPKGSKVKYEYDHETGLMFVDRILHCSMVYPHNYGFIPGTICEDGDALDVLVIMQEQVHSGCYLRAKVLGMIHMIDEGKKDDKIIAVHADDPEYTLCEKLSDLPPHRLKEIETFFSDYKKNEGKHVLLNGFGTHSEAIATVLNSKR